MMNWSPDQWGEAALAVASGFFTARFFFLLVCGLFGGSREPIVVHVTIEREGD